MVPRLRTHIRLRGHQSPYVMLLYKSLAVSYEASKKDLVFTILKNYILPLGVLPRQIRLYLYRTGRQEIIRKFYQPRRHKDTKTK